MRDLSYSLPIVAAIVMAFTGCEPSATGVDSCGSTSAYCRSGERANSGGGDTGSRGMDIGFRPARTIEP